MKASTQLFPQISRVLKLTRVQEVAVALALLSSSRSDLVNFALAFAKQKLPELIRSYVDVGKYCLFYEESFAISMQQNVLMLLFCQ